LIASEEQPVARHGRKRHSALPLQPEALYIPHVWQISESLSFQGTESAGSYSRGHESCCRYRRRDRIHDVGLVRGPLSPRRNHRPAGWLCHAGRDFDAIFVGALGDPRCAFQIFIAKEILLGMRFKMDLYANVRPVKLLDEALCPLKNVKPEDVDFVVIRENTEGPYVDAGGVFKPGHSRRDRHAGRLQHPQGRGASDSLRV